VHSLERGAARGISAASDDVRACEVISYAQCAVISRYSEHTPSRPMQVIGTDIPSLGFVPYFFIR
jgi:hypothetical protein